MPDSTATNPATAFHIRCVGCDRVLNVQHAWISRLVKCPHCDAAMRVPPPGPSDKPPRGMQPPAAGSRVFNFGCPACAALLQGHTGISETIERCPACGARLSVPHFDPLTHRPGPAILQEADDDEARAPLAPYAADGLAAPRVVRGPDGQTYIECPHCHVANEVDASACRDCGTPFSAEGITDARRAQGVSPVAMIAVLSGVVAVPLFQFVLPAAVAVLLGIVTWTRPEGAAGRAVATIGAALGVVSGGMAGWYYF